MENKPASQPAASRGRASVYWLVAIMTTLTAAVLVIAMFPARAQSAQTTQTFRPARFALETAEINVYMREPHGANTQKVLFKIDTITGEVWTLQMTVHSFLNPRVISSNWVRVHAQPPPQPSIFQQF